MSLSVYEAIIRNSRVSRDYDEVSTHVAKTTHHEKRDKEQD